MRKTTPARVADPRTTPLSCSLTLSERKKVIRHARAERETLSGFLRVAALERIARLEGAGEAAHKLAACVGGGRACASVMPRQ